MGFKSAFEGLYRVAQKERMFFFISACDFFLWGYLKSKVYVRKLRTVEVLKVSIREEITTVQFNPGKDSVSIV